MSSMVSVSQFFFSPIPSIDPDLARNLVRVSRPRNLPVVLSRHEVGQLHNAKNIRHRCRFSMEPDCFWRCDDAQTRAVL
jgi:integrase/recombinase XerD